MSGERWIGGGEVRREELERVSEGSDRSILPNATTDIVSSRPPSLPAHRSGKAQTYDGCVVHRVQSEFVVQTGDFVFGNGSGGESVFGKKFKDEKNGLTIKHDRRGLVSMGNSGKNSNTSQFFITFAALPQCDGKHVVFGEVVAGFEVLNLIEQIAGSADGNPKVGVKVFKAGLWNKSMPAAGYWMRVPDNCFSGSTPVFFAFPRVLVVAPTEAATLKFRSALQSTCVCVVETLVVSSEKVGETLEETAKTRGHAYDYILLAPAFQEEQIGSFEGIRMGFSKPLVGEVGPLVWEAFKEWKLDPRAL